MKRGHKTSYVWLRRGSRGVIGFNLEELNSKIDEWNQGNPLMSHVHIIKLKEVKVDAGI